jgi:zinc D-Ala-D-Ala carboxypeptidase
MDTRQVQASLASLGWPIAVDGSYGPTTFQAVKDFQLGFSPYDLLVDGHAGPQTWQALNTSLYFGGACGDGFLFREWKSKGNGWIKVHRHLVRCLVEYKKRYGKPTIVSGYRDPLRNRQIGGASNSQHLYGNAADIPGVASINAVRNLGLFSGIGYRASDGKVVHVDVREAGPNTTGGTSRNPTVWRYAS